MYTLHFILNIKLSLNKCTGFGSSPFLLDMESVYFMDKIYLK